MAHWVVVNAEDPVQTDISILSAGNDIHFRLGKLLTAFLACAGLAATAIVTPLLVHDYPGAVDDIAAKVALGGAAHLLGALFGVAIGAVASRPVIRRAGWALFVATGACLADIVIPTRPDSATSRPVRTRPPERRRPRRHHLPRRHHRRDGHPRSRGDHRRPHRRPPTHIEIAMQVDFR